ncbi:alcohol dehydrogenase catalytic domain-containing protein [Leucobacter allii]|uniref:Alcohol dehydrogenase catalytic domain-containing protein n=1 Tax=Leucobacter allii TaxID=2932247 RepID=A0ABY4FKS1_9MICO|nr:alcohol dehydrogenase catalytic domain-containing protein [Leucobacter allii]UOQ56868.1 alcohol dehydrogenase catalytic domain-containing protein [Leucobacter allii]
MSSSQAGTMRAAVLHAVGDLRIDEVPVPVPGPGEVLIKIGVCGVCGSDAVEYGKQLVLAHPPVTLGHEFVGTVEALGTDVTGLEVGATVVSGAGISCGACKPCLAGRTNLCRSYTTQGFHHDGGLAGYVVAPAAIVLDVSDSGLAVDTLGLTQPMAIAVHAVRRSGLTAGDTAVIVGAGGIGAFITVAAAGTGAEVIVVDLNEERLELARALGAAHTFLAGGDPLAEQLSAAGLDPDVFFEVSGSAPGFASVLDAAAPGSTIVPVGVQRTPPQQAIGTWTLSEYLIVGTVAHVFATDFPEAIRLLSTRPDWSDIASEVVPLGELIPQALDPLLNGAAAQIKTLIDPWIEVPRPALHVRP